MEISDILKRIKAGSILTIGRGKKAHLDKYTANETEINHDLAFEITFLNDIECDGGNLDTGDRHYQYKNMETGITVLSLFDGIGCLRLALEQAGIKVNKYFASEIDPYAIKIAKKNWPDIIHIGDITKVSFADGWLNFDGGMEYVGMEYVGTIHIVAGGSPCQGLSLQGKHLNFNDPRSVLFYEWLRIAHEVCAPYFLLENVPMKKESEDIITELVGIEPHKINSLQFGAQSRKRNYWTNIPVAPIEAKSFDPQSIIEGPGHPMTVRKKDKQGNARPIYRTPHFGCATHSYYKGIRADGRPAIGLVEGGFYDEEYPQGNIRALTPTEYEALQNLPKGYTEGISKTQRYMKVGDGWDVAVIAHILKGLKSELESELNSF